MVEASSPLWLFLTPLYSHALPEVASLLLFFLFGIFSNQLKGAFAGDQLS